MFIAPGSQSDLECICSLLLRWRCNGCLQAIDVTQSVQKQQHAESIASIQKAVAE